MGSGKLAAEITELPPPGPCQSRFARGRFCAAVAGWDGRRISGCDASVGWGEARDCKCLNCRGHSSLGQPALGQFPQLGAGWQGCRRIVEEPLFQISNGLPEQRERFGVQPFALFQFLQDRDGLKGSQ